MRHSISFYRPKQDEIGSNEASEGSTRQVRIVALGEELASKVVVDGDILVWGDLKAAAGLVAKGNLVVHGNIHGSQIRAKGSVLVHGIIGHGATVSAGGDIWAYAAENAVLKTDADIHISDHVAFSNFKAAGNITIEGEAWGGSLEAGKSLHAGSLGHSMGTPTLIKIAAGRSKFQTLTVDRTIFAGVNVRCNGAELHATSNLPPCHLSWRLNGIVARFTSARIPAGGPEPPSERPSKNRSRSAIA